MLFERVEKLEMQQRSGNFNIVNMLVQETNITMPNEEPSTSTKQTSSNIPSLENFIQAWEIIKIIWKGLMKLYAIFHSS